MTNKTDFFTPCICDEHIPLHTCIHIYSYIHVRKYSNLISQLCGACFVNHFGAWFQSQLDSTKSPRASWCTHTSQGRIRLSAVQLCLTIFTWPNLGMQNRPAMLTISTSPVVGMVDGRGYDGRQKDAICDVRGPCLTIWSTFKPVCRWFRMIGYTYELLRCLDVEIWRFSWWQQTDRQTDGQTNRLLYPCACARGNNMTRLLTQCINTCQYGVGHSYKFVGKSLS